MHVHHIHINDSKVLCVIEKEEFLWLEWKLDPMLFVSSITEMSRLISIVHMAYKRHTTKQD